MTTALLFLSAIMVVAVGWLVRRTINVEPWVEQRRTTQLATNDGVLALLPVQVGLGVFLAVATSLFALLVSAYHMRMAETDWNALTVPRVLWLNTVVLVLASVAMQWTVFVARREDAAAIRKGLTASGVFSFAFLGGQLWAWQQLSAAGHFSVANPALAFFLLLTAAHGVHLLGGLWVWARTTFRVLRGYDMGKIRLSVELCAVYWHYLLLVWAVLFAVLLQTQH